MKANELRIGNLVYFKLEEVEVTMIGEYGIQSNKNQILINAKFSTPDIKPIPLTEDWLLKFGAVKRFASEWDYHLSIGAIKIYFRHNQKWYCELEGIYLDSKIQYVHQLQNLYFALTGHEIEIKP